MRGEKLILQLCSRSMPYYSKYETRYYEDGLLPSAQTEPVASSSVDGKSWKD